MDVGQRRHDVVSQFGYEHIDYRLLTICTKRETTQNTRGNRPSSSLLNRLKDNNIAIGVQADLLLLQRAFGRVPGGEDLIQFLEL